MIIVEITIQLKKNSILFPKSGKLKEQFFFKSTSFDIGKTFSPNFFNLMPLIMVVFSCSLYIIPTFWFWQKDFTNKQPFLQRSYRYSSVNLGTHSIFQVKLEQLKIPITKPRKLQSLINWKKLSSKIFNNCVQKTSRIG